MTTKTTTATQDYLKAIYDLCQLHGKATTSLLAEALKVRAASVTNMVQKLASHPQPLIVYQKHHGVTLTELGEKAALSVLRQHRLLETYLFEKLDYGWDEVHEEAERLEHALSEKMVRRMAASLGNPKRDPHGQRIPDANLKMSPSQSVPLSSLKSRQTAVIRRVDDKNAELLRSLDKLGLRPPAEIAIIKVQKDTTGKARHYHLKIKNERDVIIIGKEITDSIFVDNIQTLT